MLRFVLLLACMAALLGLFIAQLGRFLAVSEVALPDVVGMASEDAQQLLRGLGLEPTTYTENFTNFAINAVSSQSPEPGILVRKGRTVALGINIPDTEVQVPQLVQSTRVHAQNILNTLNLDLGEISYEFSEAPEGEIIRQVPEAGVVIGTGGRVAIVLSRGPDVPKISMPEVRGLSVEEAKRRLSGLGFKHFDAKATSVSFDRPNVVTDQMPLAKQEVSVSTRVLLGFAMPADQVVQVPSLINIPLSQAQTLLAGASLSLGAITYVTDPAQAPGIITYAPSTYTLRGSPIEVTVNRAGLTEPITNLAVPPSLSPEAGLQSDQQLIPQPVPQSEIATAPQTQSQNPAEEATAQLDPVATLTADGSRIVPFKFDPTFMGIQDLLTRPYQLRLEVSDERGEKRILLEQRVPAGRSIETKVTVYGEAQLQIYVNDFLMQAYSP